MSDSCVHDGELEETDSGAHACAQCGDFIWAYFDASEVFPDGE